MPAFGGVFSVLPTPFEPTGEVDFDSLRRVVDLFIRAGVNGLTGEVPRLSEPGRGHVLRTVLEHANGRVPVVAGATSEGLRTCVAYTRHARDAGAAAVMISPPRMPKINSDAVLRHFAEVARR